VGVAAPLFYRWVGFWAVRRAYRVLQGEGDSRPLKARVTHEARRLLIGAGVVVLLAVVLLIAGIVTLIVVLD
jgi:hypothetical protein